ncbi:Hypothetical protein POVR2_LOCUS158 [uncultured virus]|nr:Hypothetical protein POVR2_LOCUS158 [uncultured virus]
MNELLPELFFELALRLDNSSLSELYYTSTQLRRQFKKLLASQEFWKSRAESLIASGWSDKLAAGMSRVAPKDADWKTIYNNLAKAEQHFLDVAKHNKMPEREAGRNSMDIGHTHVDVNPHQYGVNDLGTMLVVIGLYGPPDWNKSISRHSRIDKEHNVWHSIHNPSVLSLLLKSNYLQSVTVSNYMQPIAKNIAAGNLDAVLALLDMYPGEDLASIVKSTLKLAVASSGTTMLRSIVERYSHIELDLLAILKAAVAENNPSAFTYISSLQHFTEKQLIKIVSSRSDKNNAATVALALENISLTKQQSWEIYNSMRPVAREQVMRLLLAKGLQVTAGEWRKILNDALKNSSDDELSLIKLALEHISPVTKTNQALVLAAHEKERLQIIMSDKRVDILLNLDSVINNLNPDTVYIFLQDDRIDLAKLTGKQLAELGNTMPYDYRPSYEVLASETTYFEILRYIVFKQPSALKLAKWMIALRDQDVAQAAAVVLDSTLSYSDTVAPIRALLICLLYPTLSLDENIQALVAEGYASETLKLSTTLIKICLDLKVE